MPRKAPILKMMDEYLSRCEQRGVAELSIYQYKRTIIRTYQKLKTANLNHNPATIDKDEIYYVLKHSCDHDFRVFNIFLKWCGNSIVQKEGIVLQFQEPMKRVWLDQYQAQDLLDACHTGKEPEKELMYIHLMLECGFRVIECQRALKTDFTDIPGRIIVRGKGRRRPRIKTIKKHPNTNDIYDAWMRARNELLRSNGLTDDNPHLLIYVKGTLRNYAPKGILSILPRIAKRIDLRAPHHSLRRTFATTLYNNGVPKKTIKKLLRHDHERTTELYIGVEDEEEEEAMMTLYKQGYRSQPQKPQSQTVRTL